MEERKYDNYRETSMVGICLIDISLADHGKDRDFPPRWMERMNGLISKGWKLVNTHNITDENNVSIGIMTHTRYVFTKEIDLGPQRGLS